MDGKSIKIASSSYKSVLPIKYLKLTKECFNIFIELPSLFEIVNNKSLNEAEMLLYRRCIQSLKVSDVLLRKGYYPESATTLRLVLECINLILFLRKDELNVNNFFSLKSIEFSRYFQPGKIRQIINVSERDKKLYNILSNFGVHPSYSSRIFLTNIGIGKSKRINDGKDDFLTNVPLPYKLIGLILAQNILYLVNKLLNTIIVREDVRKSIKEFKTTIKGKLFLDKILDFSKRNREEIILESKMISKEFIKHGLKSNL